jgi:hypothetical protein
MDPIFITTALLATVALVIGSVTFDDPDWL